jgi:hypothetical protein
MNCQVFFLLKEFDEGTVEPGVDIPIQTPEIIAGRIVAIISEFNTAATPRGSAFPFDRTGSHA